MTMTRIPDHAAPTLLSINGMFFAAALQPAAQLPSDIVRSALRAKKMLPTVGTRSVEELIKRSFDEMRTSSRVAIFPCTESRQLLHVSESHRSAATQLPGFAADIDGERATLTVQLHRNVGEAAAAASQALLLAIQADLGNELRRRLPRIRGAAIAHEREAVREASNHWMSTFAVISMTAARCTQAA